MDTTTEYHEDNNGNRSVHYWSVFAQVWRDAEYVEDIPDAEYSAMGREERDAVIAYLDRQPNPADLSDHADPAKTGMDY
jgi:hypothetical protein